MLYLLALDVEVHDDSIEFQINSLNLFLIL